jgi:hypothetical protein
MFQEGIGDIGNMPARLRKGTRALGQHLRQKPRTASQNRIRTAGHFIHRQHALFAKPDVAKLGDIAQYLAIGPGLTVRDNRHLSQAKAGELITSAVIFQHIPGHEGHAVTPEKLLGPKAGRTSGHPIVANGLIRCGDIVHGFPPR